MSDYMSQWATRFVKENRQPRQAAKVKESSKRRHGFTRDRHEEIGAELSKIRTSLINLTVEICRAYGPSHRLYRAVRTLQTNIDRLRHYLDDQIFEEVPRTEWHTGEKDLSHIYYPPHDKP